MKGWNNRMPVRQKGLFAGQSGLPDSGSRKTDGMTPWLFLLPSLLSVGVLVLFPFADVVRRSFFSAMGGQFVGIKNYWNVLQNEAFRLAAGNTAVFTLLCIPLLLGVSLMLALLVSAGKEKAEVFKTTFLIPMSIPAASVVLLWKAVFHENGLANRLLEAAGGAPTDWLNSGTAMGVLLFTYIWKNAGYDMVLWLSGLTSISPALYEAAALDGAGALRRFLRITLPGLRLTLMPFQVTMVSGYFILDRLGLMNTVWAVILPGAVSTFPVFIMTRFFAAIPSALTEAAELDGADPWRVFLYLGLPVGFPGVLSAVVLGFLEYWGALEQPMTFLKDQTKWPLSLYLPAVTAENAGTSLAAAVLTLAPALLIFLFGQKYLEAGIAASGMKD